MKNQRIKFPAPTFEEDELEIKPEQDEEPDWFPSLGAFYKHVLGDLPLNVLSEATGAPVGALNKNGYLRYRLGTIRDAARLVGADNVQIVVTKDGKQYTIG